MNADELKHRIANISVWTNGNKRALHKPLLILYALGCFQRSQKTISYIKVKEKLTSLLNEYSNTSKHGQKPYEPFIRLQKDQIWELSEQINPDKFSMKQLSEVNGSFTKEVSSLLESERNLIKEIADIILEKHFSVTHHKLLLDEVGLNIDSLQSKQRDPKFRIEVLRVYERRCAVCGFNVQLGSNTIALEAAHIKWRGYGGVDSVDNGLSLCSMHHTLFDSGVFTLNKDNQILVSEEAFGREGFSHWLLNHHGKEIIKPISDRYLPNKQYKEWHNDVIFKSPARQIGG